MEVLRKEESHQHRHTDSDIRIAGKVRIDLQRIGKQRKQILRTREQHWVLKHTVNETDRKEIAQYNLFDKSVEYPEDSDAKLPPAQLVRTVELRNELGGTNDRTGYQLWEKRNIESKVQQVADRLNAAMIDIGYVRNNLKRIETDTYR